MPRDTPDPLTAISIVLLVAAVFFALPVIAWLATRQTPAPGYGTNAYLGRPPGARLDVDLFGDPRYGGTTPEVVVLSELQQKVDYHMPRIPVLGAPDRVDHWPTMPYLNRLVWFRPEGEVWLLLTRIRDKQDLQRVKAAMRPMQATNGPWSIASFQVLGSQCSYYTGGLMGDLPELTLISPDRKVALDFQSRTLILEQAKLWAKSYLTAALRTPKRATVRRR